MSRTQAKRNADPKPKAEGQPAATKPAEGMRDLVEQLVVAFLLAVLIKGFLAEAYVIPTGSMAPTLYGQHKEVTCPHCGHLFAVNASEEAEEAGDADSKDPEAQKFIAKRRSDRQILGATCVNCRGAVGGLDKAPSFKGDRILVMRSLFGIPTWLGGSPPERWDVVVFHYPEEPETNYIKRLVGLPNEVLRVHYGDILTKPLHTPGRFRIARKPLPHQQAMQQWVWDDSHRPKPFENYADWKRWQPEGAGSSEETPGHFELAPPKGKDSWAGLRYHHFVPTPEQWHSAAEGTNPGKPRASLIDDYYSYNSGISMNRFYDQSWFRPNWVGDLTVSARVEAASATGLLRLDLVEGGVHNLCEIDLATGLATLSRRGKVVGKPVPTAMKGDGRPHDLGFANVDDRLTLWVDGTTPFEEGVSYDDGDAPHAVPTAEDLAPVGISSNAAGLKVSGLALKRDIYYTQDPSESDYSFPSALMQGIGDDSLSPIARFLGVLSDPARFEHLDKLGFKDYEIRPGRYMMMGDNSPKSKDGRAWRQQDSEGYYDPQRRIEVKPWAERGDRSPHEVPESLLIGKAFFVYWPHGVPFRWNWGFSRDFRIPFYPYVQRMKWIR